MPMIQAVNRIQISLLMIATIWCTFGIHVLAGTCTSTDGGNWSSFVWDCGTPASTDDVVIANGHTITLDTSPTINSFTIQNGGTLNGASNTTLNVTGNWNNQGAFTHNGTNVILAGSSGIQTISGSTTFDRLNTSNSAEKDFGSSNITIEKRFIHDGGIMSGGTSTFTFLGSGSYNIGGDNLKKFHHFVIAGSVSHTSNNLEMTGDLTVNDGADLTQTSSRQFRFTGSGDQFVNLNGSGSIELDQMIIDSSAKVTLPDAANTQLTAETVTNNGVLKQTQTGVSGATDFIRIRNQADTATVYQAVQITPDSSPDITVALTGNTSVCNEPDGRNYRDRCFKVTSSAAANTSVTLFTTADEDDIANDAFYELTGNDTWTHRAGCADDVNEGGSCTASIALSAGDNYFLIGDSNSAPTPVTLTAFFARRRSSQVEVVWRTETEINFAGFLVERSEEESGPYRPISPLIVAQGAGISGADYLFLDLDAPSDHIYFYRLKALDFDGSAKYHGPIQSGPFSQNTYPYYIDVQKKICRSWANRSL